MQSMHKFILLSVLCFILLAFGFQGLKAEDNNYLLKIDNVDFGFYVDPALQATVIKNKGESFNGLGAGLIINHTITVGLAEYMLGNSLSGGRLKTDVDGTNHRDRINYGGVQLGYILNPSSLFHFNFSALIGGGSIFYHDINLIMSGNPNHIRTHDRFFVLEPMINLELNLCKYIRPSIGVGYRYVNGINGFPDYSNKDLMGPVVDLQVKIGMF